MGKTERRSGTPRRGQTPRYARTPRTARTTRSLIKNNCKNGKSIEKVPNGDDTAKRGMTPQKFGSIYDRLMGYEKKKQKKLAEAKLKVKFPIFTEFH